MSQTLLGSSATARIALQRCSWRAHGAQLSARLPSRLRTRESDYAAEVTGTAATSFV